MVKDNELSAWFRCADGCDYRADLTEVVYECPRCGGLLEVEHDRAALARRPAAEWKALFDSRFRLGPWPFGSGVWGKKEWVYPQLAVENVVSMFEGGNPLLRVDRYARDRKSTRLNSSHITISYAVFCL